MADLHSQLPISTGPRSVTALFGEDSNDSQPLWFKKNAFLQPDFDSESYIADLRRFVALDTLRVELRGHLAVLKNELVELINRDYADFVNLSTKLVDVDGAVLRMRTPLMELRSKISSVRESVDSSLLALQNGLQRRAEACSSREILELLLDTSHVVSKVEKLMVELQSMPDNSHVEPASKSPLSNGTITEIAENGANLEETRSMLLERIASEMNRLKFYIARAQVRHDVSLLVKEINGSYLEHVTSLLVSCPMEVLSLVKQSILQSAQAFVDTMPTIMDAMVEALVEKSVEVLRQVKGITATYRMTHKPPPVRHSPYISGVLQPLKVFLEGERAVYLTGETRNELLQSAAERITGRYNELAWEVVTVAKKTESSLQRIRQGAQKRGGTGTDSSDGNISDTDKICMQLFLDVQEYGRRLAALGVAAGEIPFYRSLWQCVAPPDKQSSIQF